MLRQCLTAIAVMVATQVQGETLRQFHAETSTPLNEIATALEQRLPDNLLARLDENLVTIAYSGNRLPPALAGFLHASFEQVAPDAVETGKTLSLSLTLQGDASGTTLSLILMGSFPASRVPLLPDSVMMMDGSGPGACQGQQVLRHPAAPEETAESYLNALENEGFAFPDAAPDEVSFFIGQAPDCQIAMYLQPDQNTTLVVIRYLED